MSTQPNPGHRALSFLPTQPPLRSQLQITSLSWHLLPQCCDPHPAGQAHPCLLRHCRVPQPCPLPQMRPCSLRGEARDGENEANKKGVTDHPWLQRGGVGAAAPLRAWQSPAPCTGFSTRRAPTCPSQHSHLPTLHTSLLPSLQRLQDIRGVAPKWPFPGPPSPLLPPDPGWDAAGPPLPAVIPAQLQPRLSLSRCGAPPGPRRTSSRTMRPRNPHRIRDAVVVWPREGRAPRRELRPPHHLPAHSEPRLVL